MQSNSKREELIAKLKQDNSIRERIPQEDIDRIKATSDIENEEEFWLLLEHLRYLRHQRRTDEVKSLIHDVEDYLLIAQFGDRNVGRFNKAVV